jgi:hypothetical protein
MTTVPVFGYTVAAAKQDECTPKRKAPPHRGGVLLCGGGFLGGAGSLALAFDAAALLPLAQFGVDVIPAVANDDWIRKVRLLRDPVPRHPRRVRKAVLEQDEAAVAV